MVDQADNPAVPAEDRDERWAARKVTSATAEVANDVSEAVAPRPMIAPIATATAKSNALSWAIVRRSPRRRPITATAKSRTALTATHPRPLAPPINSGTCLTPALVTRSMPPPRSCCHLPLTQRDATGSEAALGRSHYAVGQARPSSWVSGSRLSGPRRAMSRPPPGPCSCSDYRRVAALPQRGPASGQVRLRARDGGQARERERPHGRGKRLSKTVVRCGAGSARC
jgi:hypothetical protein